MNVKENSMKKLSAVNSTTSFWRQCDLFQILIRNLWKMSNQDSLLCYGWVLFYQHGCIICGAHCKIKMWPLVQRRWRTSRRQQQSLKASMGPSKCEALCDWLHGSYALTCPESFCVLPKCTVNERSQIHISLFMEQNKHFNQNKSENLLTRIHF